MLNSYQVIQQLTIISKRLVSEYDAPKKEALEYAIRVINERIESQEPCVFDLGQNNVSDAVLDVPKRNTNMIN